MNEKIMMMKSMIICLLTLVGSFHLQAQQIDVDRVEPHFWWTDMENKDLQLLVYGNNIAQAQPGIEYEGVRIVKVHKADNPNYLFIDLEIAEGTQPGNFPIIFYKKAKEVARFDYVLKVRHGKKPLDIDASDVIYLITPDRFVNGDPSNDVVKSMKEGLNRENHGGRHGGDLNGVLGSMDYFDELGVTALWLNPVLENDMPEYSYHGYSTTDYYKVDPRYGNNEMYKQLSDELHKKDMKLIMDMIFNHCGLGHWWMNDLPFKDWVHDFGNYEITNHAIASVSDPYASEVDLQMMTRGWFVPSMPDLNHENEFMATYLIQNSIWWIEYASLDGIRMDTYPYNNKEMMVEWAERVYKEYPGFYLLGETWVDNEAIESYWADKAESDIEYDSKLASITDFPLTYAMHKSFQEDGDLINLYLVLSKDFLYDNAGNNTIFAGNHDMDRYFYTIKEDVDKFKMAMTFLLTTRGIPQLYYGDEILMNGAGDHGILREDFPGGWAGDKSDAFKPEGRTDEQNNAFNHLKTLLNWRKTSTAIHEGELKHFVPTDNIYVYNRKSGDESVLVIINNNKNEKELDMKRFAEVTEGFSSAQDIVSGEEISVVRKINLPANTSMVLELMP